MIPVRQRWKSALEEGAFKAESVVTIALLLATLAGASRFYLWIEARAGVVLYDPFLALFPPRDVTWITFSVIYGALLVVSLSLAPHPHRLVQAIQAYILLTLFRVAMMWSLPLDPPPTAIPLSDPFVEIIGTGTTLTRDLFFSGHTSLMFLLYLVCNEKLKPLLLASTLVVGGCVLLQHVHYTVDVLVAPFVSYASIRLAQRANTRWLRRTTAGGRSRR